MEALQPLEKVAIESVVTDLGGSVTAPRLAEEIGAWNEKTAAARGAAYEGYINNKNGGTGPFFERGREFDGANGNRWWEVKSGAYWDVVLSSENRLGKFRSDIGDHQAIAASKGATFEVFSEKAVPQEIKAWLKDRGITTTEGL